MKLSQIVKKHKEISTLDPFGIDHELALLPEINSNKDINKLKTILSIIADKSNLIEQANFTTSHAMLRDVGFVVSSLRRFDIQICEEDKIIERALLLLGAKTNSIPRETSYHYGICNPSDNRQRTFTNFPDEIHLINGVRFFAADLEEILSALIDAYCKVEENEKITDHQINSMVKSLQSSFQRVGEELKNIDPQIFSRELRPYFDPIIISGKEYVGPGGGQVPLLIIDNLLFAFNLPSTHIYNIFSEEGVNFLPEELRLIFEEFKNKKTFVELSMNKKHNSAKILLNQLLNELIKYRQVHYNVAKRALNEQNQGNYQTGSAGYRIQMVHETLLATKEAKRILNQKN